MHDHRAAHESAAMLEGIPGYQIKRGSSRRQHGPLAREGRLLSGTSTPQRRTPALPVYGMDLNDGGVRQRTLEHARDTDAMATSPDFMLQGGAGDRRGFFVALPVYAPASRIKR